MAVQSGAMSESGSSRDLAAFHFGILPADADSQLCFPSARLLSGLPAETASAASVESVLARSKALMDDKFDVSGFVAESLAEVPVEGLREHLETLTRATRSKVVSLVQAHFAEFGAIAEGLLSTTGRIESIRSPLEVLHRALVKTREAVAARTTLLEISAAESDARASIAFCLLRLCAVRESVELCDALARAVANRLPHVSPTNAPETRLPGLFLLATTLKHVSGEATASLAILTQAIPAICQMLRDASTSLTELSGSIASLNHPTDSAGSHALKTALSVVAELQTVVRDAALLVLGSLKGLCLSLWKHGVTRPSLSSSAIAPPSSLHHSTHPSSLVWGIEDDDDDDDFEEADADDLTVTASTDSTGLHAGGGQQSELEIRWSGLIALLEAAGYAQLALCIDTQCIESQADAAGSIWFELIGRETLRDFLTVAELDRIHCVLPQMASSDLGTPLTESITATSSSASSSSSASAAAAASASAAALPTATKSAQHVMSGDTLSTIKSSRLQSYLEVAAAVGLRCVDQESSPDDSSVLETQATTVLAAAWLPLAGSVTSALNRGASAWRPEIPHDIARSLHQFQRARVLVIEASTATLRATHASAADDMDAHATAADDMAAHAIAAAIAARLDASPKSVGLREAVEGAMSVAHAVLSSECLLPLTDALKQPADLIQSDGVSLKESQTASSAPSLVDQRGFARTGDGVELRSLERCRLALSRVAGAAAAAPWARTDSSIVSDKGSYRVWVVRDPASLIPDLAPQLLGVSLQALSRCRASLTAAAESGRRLSVSMVSKAGSARGSDSAPGSSSAVAVAAGLALTQVRDATVARWRANSGARDRVGDDSHDDDEHQQRSQEAEDDEHQQRSPETEDDEGDSRGNLSDADIALWSTALQALESSHDTASVTHAGVLVAGAETVSGRTASSAASASSAVSSRVRVDESVATTATGESGAVGLRALRRLGCCMRDAALLRVWLTPSGEVAPDSAVSLGDLLASRVGPSDSVRDALDGVAQALSATELHLSASMQAICTAMGGRVMTASLTSLARGDSSTTVPGSTGTSEKRRGAHANLDGNPHSPAATHGMDMPARIQAVELSRDATWLTPVRDTALLISNALTDSSSLSACLESFASGATVSLTAMASAVSSAQSKSQAALSWLSDSKSDAQSQVGGEAAAADDDNSADSSLKTAWKMLRASMISKRQ